MKKILLLFGLMISFLSFCQSFQDAPWMEQFDLENRSTPLKFEQIVDAANTYFATIDINAKGSGYKVFKRWETRWINFVDDQGYLPNGLDFWNSWNETEAFSSHRSTMADDSNWTSLGPTDFTNRPTSYLNIGRVNVIVKDPNNDNILYAGAPAGGIWKSTDEGLSWNVLTDNLPQIGVSGIAVDPNNSQIIYIATGDDDAGDSIGVGVWKSTDGGTTWNPAGFDPNNSPSRMNDIYINPNDSNMLWVATTSGLYRSTNAGSSWTVVQGGNIRDVKIKPGDPNTVYCVSSSVFYKSTNGGASFTPSSSGLPTSSGRLVIDVTPANANYVYVVSATTSSAYQGIFRSTNSGDSFSQMANTVNIFESSQAWYDLALGVSAQNEDEIYVGVLNVWKSSNGGNSFTKLNSWTTRNAAYTHADIHYLRFFEKSDGSEQLFAGTDGGFFKSVDGGTTFADLTTGMEISQFYRIDVSQQTSTRIVGGTQDNGGFGYDNIWSNYHGGDGMEGVIDPNNDNIYMGFMQNGQNLFVSNNAGQSGSSGYSGPEQGNWITPLAINTDSEVYAGYSRLYEFDGNWTAVSPSFGTNIDRLEIDPSNPDNIYVAINNSLRKSTDRGVSFTNTQSFSTLITGIEVNNNDSNIVYVTTSGFSGGVFRSTDGGSTFTNITENLPSTLKFCIVHRKDDPLNNIYLGTHVGVYRYNDNLAEWEEFDNNLPNVEVADLAINITDEVIVAGTYGRGIWISPLGETQLAENDIRLVSIDDPSGQSFKCGDVTPQIRVKNNGQNTVTTIDVVYNVDGGTNETETWTGTLNSEETTIIDLPTMTLDRGEHSLFVSVNITNDAFPSNNDSNLVFYVNDTGVAQLVNTFEDAEDELITFNESSNEVLWERGVPTGNDLNSAFSGTQVYATNLDGNHPDQTKAFLFSQCYDLSQITDPILKFHMAFEIEQDWDLVYVEYTIDEGATWSLLGSADDPNWYNSSRIAGDGVANNCFNCVGGQWTGTDLNWTQYTYALDALTNEENVVFRLVWHSDQSVNFEGAVVDNFFVDGTLSTSEFSLNDIRVYPNPSDGIFTVKTTNIETYDYEVIDITGKTILSQKDVISNYHQVDMSNFSNGIYFLKLQSGSQQTTFKLMVK